MTAASGRGPSEHGFQAAMNALKLGGSLAVTVGIALVARVILLPRYLGPEQYGTLSFVEAFTTAVFILLSFGAEVYIQKEVSVRPEHANDFYGGLLLLRWIFLPLLLGGTVVTLRLAGVSVAWKLLLVFCTWQVFVRHNETLAAMLRARGTVDGLSAQTVIAKVVWGIAIVAAAAARLGLVAIAIGYLLPEVLKTFCLTYLVRRHIRLKLRWNGSAVRSMLAQSMPFYINAITIVAYANLDRFVLMMVVGDEAEVGWYAAAANLGGLVTLISPILSWVALPLFSQAFARSTEEFFATARRVLEVVLVLVLPLALALGLGADLWLRIPGKEFAPARLSLQLIAPLQALSYVNLLTAQGLIILGRGWHLTAISACGMILSPLLNWLLVGPFHAMLHAAPGYASAATAAARLVVECVVCVAMFATLGRDLFDRRASAMLLRNLLCCGLTIAVHVALAPLGLARLAADALAYLALVVALRAVPFAEVAGFVREARRRRAGAAPSAAA